MLFRSVSPLIEQALHHMGELEFGKARVLLERAVQMEPRNLTVLEHLFTIDKQTPELPQFHLTTQRLLKRLMQDASGYGAACKIYKEYTLHAHPPRLTADLYLLVCKALSATGAMDEARRLLVMLIRKVPDLIGLPTALLKLSQAYFNCGREKSWQVCLQTIRDRYPMSPEAQIARKQLTQKAR